MKSGTIGKNWENEAKICWLIGRRIIGHWVSAGAHARVCWNARRGPGLSRTLHRFSFLHPPKKKEIALTSPPLNLTNQLADFEHGKAKPKRGQSGHLVLRVLWLHRSTVSTVCPEWEWGRQAAPNDDRGPEVSESHSTGPRRYHAGIILTASFRQVRWFISSGRNRSLPTFVQNGEGIPLFRWLVMLTLTPSRSWYQFQPTPFCSLRS